MTAQELLQALGSAMGAPALKFNEEHLCQVEAEGGLVPISLETDAEGTKILATAILGRVWEGMEESAAALLAMNGGFYPLGRGVFALEGENADVISLMRLFTPAILDKDAFLQQFNLFVADAREWRQRLQRQDLGFGDDEGSSEPALMGGMRI